MIMGFGMQKREMERGWEGRRWRGVERSGDGDGDGGGEEWRGVEKAKEEIMGDF